LSRKHQDALLALRALSDMAMVTLAWAAAYVIRFSGVLPISKGIPDPQLYVKMIPFIWVIWGLALAASGFYRRTGRHRSAFIEALDILQSCALATVGFIAFSYVYEEYRYSRVTLAIFAVLHPWLIITGRSLIRKALRRYRRRAAPRRTLVVGSGDTLRHAIEMAKVGDLTRSEVFGVILVGSAEQIRGGEELCRAHGLPVLTTPDDWIAFFSQHATETVVFALPHRSYEFLDQHLEQIADQVWDVKFIPDLVRFTRFAAGVDVVGGTPIVTINESPLAGIGSVVKRTVDIGGALVAIVIFSPAMLVAALLVKLSSPGPVLYRQERMGLDGHNFYMLKFRSMPVDVEKQSGAVFAKAGDNRATPIGALLRRTSLDELPQFFNVLKGDMSLVGPRPERPVFVDQFRRDVPGYYLRHKTKAGITGWAQVNGWRGNTSIEKRIECDLYYIQNWSLWLDLRIIFLTIFKGFINKNAY
jgi:Undecaprenyl-phosphate glucose phosphotransferase